MRIATWNVNSLGARLGRVEEWIGYAQPDILCMQETKFADAAFPHGAFATLGYETAHHGDGRWNGVAIASRVGMSDVTVGMGSSDDDQGSRLISCRLRGSAGDVGLRAQRAQPRQRVLPGQTGLAGGPPFLSRAEDVTRSTGGRVRGLQRGSRRPRCMEPGRIRGHDPRERGGA